MSGHDLAIGLLVAVMVGISKTALPGAGLLATPMMASVFSGRELPGSALMILLCADLFAITIYRRHARWDLLRPLTGWVAAGFAAGAAFFIAVGKADRSIEITIAVIILVMIVIIAARMVRGSQPAEPTTAAAAFYGTLGGFTTFVSNNAGPVMNSYLMRLGLSKEELVGTSAWFYFVVNVAKIPVYLGLGWWTTGGHFITGDGLTLAAASFPGVLAGVYIGRRLFPYIAQRTFMIIVLVLAGYAAFRLLAGA